MKIFNRIYERVFCTEKMGKGLFF